MDEAGVSRMQWEQDVLGCLKSLRELVQAHGLSWDEDAFYEIEQLALEAIEGRRP